MIELWVVKLFIALELTGSYSEPSVTSENIGGA